MSGYWEITFYDLDAVVEYEETRDEEYLAIARLWELKQKHPQGSGDVILVSRSVVCSVSCDDVPPSEETQQ